MQPPAASAAAKWKGKGKDAGADAAARWVTLYIEEAHPEDEWRLPASRVEEELKANGDAPITTHADLQARLEAADLFVRRKDIQSAVYVDSMQNEVLDRYQAWPERLYVVMDGVVVYVGGIGPFHFDLGELEGWLERHTQATSGLN